MKPAALSVGRDDGVTCVRDMFSMMEMSKGMTLVNGDQVLDDRRTKRNILLLPGEKRKQQDRSILKGKIRS